jgi:hypothetical protein
MGLDTLTTMRTALNFMLEDRDDVTNTELDRWLNWTYIQISNPAVARHRGLQDNFTISLLLNQVSYDVSPTATTFHVAGIQDVVYIEGGNITDNTFTRRKLRASQDVRTVAARPFSQGPPHKYTLQGEVGGAGTNLGLIIDSQPSAAEVGNLLLVNCWRYPDILTGVATMIIVGAAWRGWRDLNQPDRANEMKQQFAELTQSIATKIDVSAEDWETRFEVNLQPYQTDARG